MCCYIGTGSNSKSSRTAIAIADTKFAHDSRKCSLADCGWRRANARRCTHIIFYSIAVNLFVVVKTSMELVPVGLEVFISSQGRGSCEKELRSTVPSLCGADTMWLGRGYLHFRALKVGCTFHRPCQCLWMHRVRSQQ